MNAMEGTELGKQYHKYASRGWRLRQLKRRKHGVNL
jgi:hypothetical protein